MNVDEFLCKLSKVTGRAPKWRAICPACGGKNGQKLSVGLGAGDIILIHCFAGHSVDEVLGAAGVKMDDLYPNKSSTGKPNRRAFSSYEAIRALAPELNVAWVVLTDVARGKQISSADRKRAGEAAKRCANLINQMVA